MSFDPDKSAAYMRELAARRARERDAAERQARLRREQRAAAQARIDAAKRAVAEAKRK